MSSDPKADFEQSSAMKERTKCVIQHFTVAKNGAPSWKYVDRCTDVLTVFVENRNKSLHEILYQTVPICRRDTILN